jgi:hypothetical protein
MKSLKLHQKSSSKKTKGEDESTIPTTSKWSW